MLRSIPLISIYAFVSKKHKVIYASHSTSSITEVAKNIDELARGVHRSKELIDLYNDVSSDLELVILKRYKDNTSQYIPRAEYGFMIDKYKAMGYKDLREDYHAGEFRLKMQVLALHDSDTPLYFVIAESKRKERLVLAIFENIPEGKVWVEKHFPNKERIIPVFHNNERTKAYHAEYGLKLKN